MTVSTPVHTRSAVFPVPRIHSAQAPGGRLIAMVFILAVAASLGGVWGGPPLGDHEALVAQCARDMRLSGDWVVPQFLDTPFIRKPPLGYWLVAAASYLFPNDAATGLPVTNAVARLPSALAALGTILILWKLASAMFGRNSGLVAAVLASTCVFSLLYAPNATVEMLVTFCCVWAYAHFWFGITTHSRGRRKFHLLMFYVAFGVAMLAKGPSPLAMVGVPIAYWWYTWRAQRVIARGTSNLFIKVPVVFFRSLWRETGRACTRLWVFPGVIIFLAMFVPWMIAVAMQAQHAFSEWNWQYLQRFQGDFEDTRDRGVFYYVPILLGLLIPWTPALVESVAAPWLKRFARQRKALYFVGCWAVVGVVVMSLMGFKKPYYILPALPGFVLLIAPVMENFLRRIAIRVPSRATLAMLAMLVLVVGIGALGVYAIRPWMDTALPPVFVIVAVAMAGLVYGIWQVGRGKPTRALLTVGFGAAAAFLTGWHSLGPTFGDARRTAALDYELDEAGVPEDAAVYWVDQRPDARLRFYHKRWSEHLVDPGEIVQRSVEREKKARWLQDMVMDRVVALLGGSQPVYLIIDREHLSLREQVPPDVRSRVRVLAVVDVDQIEDENDWMVLTNADHLHTSKELPALSEP